MARGIYATTPPDASGTISLTVCFHWGIVTPGVPPVMGCTDGIAAYHKTYRADWSDFVRRAGGDYAVANALITAALLPQITLDEQALTTTPGAAVGSIVGSSI